MRLSIVKTTLVVDAFMRPISPFQARGFSETETGEKVLGGVLSAMTVVICCVCLQWRVYSVDHRDALLCPTDPTDRPSWKDARANSRRDFFLLTVATSE